jgi:hypothetical protein
MTRGSGPMRIAPPDNDEYTAHGRREHGKQKNWQSLLI